MAAGVLLDAHLATGIVVGLRRLGIDAVSLAEWRGGAYRTGSDDDNLRAAHEERRALVTFDVRSIPPLVRALAEQRSDHSGVILISRKTFAQNDVRQIVQSLARMLNERPGDAFANQVLFLARA